MRDPSFVALPVDTKKVLLTVRWRRFRGLLFALEKRAKTCLHAGVQAGPSFGLPLGGLSAFGFRLLALGFGLWALGFGLWALGFGSGFQQAPRFGHCAACVWPKPGCFIKKAAHFHSLAVRAANPLELLICPASLR